MKVVLKFHSTLTGGVDDKIKNLKPLKQIMINITICRSKPRLRIFLKNSTLPSRAEWMCRNRYLTLKFLTLEKTLTNN